MTVMGVVSVRRSVERESARVDDVEDDDEDDEEEDEEEDPKDLSDFSSLSHERVFQASTLGEIISATARRVGFGCALDQGCSHGP